MWKTSSLTEDQKLWARLKTVEVTFFGEKSPQTLPEMKMFFLCQNIDLELFFPFSSSSKRKFIGAKFVIWFAFQKLNGPAASMISEANVKEKLNGKTATALLNERSNPTYNESNLTGHILKARTGNQFCCSVKILNYENQASEFTGYGLVWFGAINFQVTVIVKTPTSIWPKFLWNSKFESFQP